MKQITTWVAILLVAALLPFGVSAQESSDSIETTRELQIAAALGMVPPDSQPDEIVTRGAAASAVIKLLGYQEVAAGSVEFSDVDSNHACFREISIAQKLGMVSGYPDNTFRPDAAISVNELIAMLVKGLGYGSVAEESGGYPAGYLKWAVNKKLLTGDVSMQKDVTNHTLAILLINAMEVTTLNPMGDAYYEGQSIMERRQMVTITGVVTRNAFGSLYDASRTAAGHVAIGDIIVAVGNTDLEDLLGYRVKVYAVQENNAKDYTAQYAEVYQTESVSIPLENLNKERNLFAECAITYYDENGREKRQTFDSGAAVLYNGTACDSRSMLLFEGGNGTIEIIDSNGDGRCDVLRIEKYVDYLVDSISEMRQSVYDKFGRTLNLEPGGSAHRVEIADVDGNAVALTDLSEWQVVSVYDSAVEQAEVTDARSVKAVVSQNVIMGTVSEVQQTPGTNRTVVIEDTEYTVSPCYGKSDKIIPIAVGLVGNFYLNFNGEICGFRPDTLRQLDKQYGVLVSAKQEGSVDQSVVYQIFTLQDTFIYPHAAETIEIDGKRVKDDARYSAFLEDGQIKRQVVKYELNEAGDVTYFDTGIRTEDEAGNTLKKVYAKEDEQLTWRLGLKTFNNRYNISNNTICFSVPGDPADLDAYASSFSLKDGDKYNADIYIEDNKFDASAVVIEDASALSSDVTDFSVIAGITTVLHNEQPTDKMVVYNKKGEVTEYISDTCTGRADIAKGDIISYSKNAQGEVTSIQVIYDLSERQALYPDYGFATDNRVYVGQAYEKLGDWISIAAEPITPDTANQMLESRNVSYYTAYVYDTVTETVTAATAKDILPYTQVGKDCSLVVVSDKTAWPVTMIIYNFE